MGKGLDLDFKMKPAEVTWVVEFPKYDRNSLDWGIVWDKFRRNLYSHPDVRGIETIEDGVVHVTVYGYKKSGEVREIVARAIEGAI